MKTFPLKNTGSNCADLVCPPERPHKTREGEQCFCSSAVPGGGVERVAGLVRFNPAVSVRRQPGALASAIELPTALETALRSQGIDPSSIDPSKVSVNTDGSVNLPDGRQVTLTPDGSVSINTRAVQEAGSPIDINVYTGGGAAVGAFVGYQAYGIAGALAGLLAGYFIGRALKPAA